MKNKVFNVCLILLMVIIVILIVNYTNTPKKGELIQVNYKEVLQKVDNNDTFVLIVSQSTCSHCATYKPKIKEIAEEHGLDIYYIDYDKESKKDSEKFLEEFHLSGATPITLFFKNGKEKSILNRIEGDLPSSTLEQLEKLGFID